MPGDFQTPAVYVFIVELKKKKKKAESGHDQSIWSEKWEDICTHIS